MFLIQLALPFLISLGSGWKEKVLRGLGQGAHVLGAVTVLGSFWHCSVVGFGAQVKGY